MTLINICSFRTFCSRKRSARKSHPDDPAEALGKSLSVLRPAARAQRANAGHTILWECCRADTPVAFLSNASTTRLTTTVRSLCDAVLVLISLMNRRIVGVGAFFSCPFPRWGKWTISMEDKKAEQARVVDMSFPLSHPCIGEVGQDADELPEGRNPDRRDHVGRHGAPT
jgi:hypothetical protein